MCCPWTVLPTPATVQAARQRQILRVEQRWVWRPNLCVTFRGSLPLGSARPGPLLRSWRRPGGGGIREGGSGSDGVPGRPFFSFPPTPAPLDRVLRDAPGVQVPRDVGLMHGAHVLDAAAHAARSGRRAAGPLRRRLARPLRQPRQQPCIAGGTAAPGAGGPGSQASLAPRPRLLREIAQLLHVQRTPGYRGHGGARLQ